MVRSILRLALLASLSVLPLACGGGEEPTLELPELTPFDEKLALQVTSISLTASEVRGLEPSSGLEQGTLSREQLADYYRQAATEAQLQEDINYEALNTQFRLLHMMGANDDLLKISGDSGAEGILGFYTHEGNQLVLISDTPGELSLDNESTLAHEYVHSFQDEEFDLEKLLKRVDKEQREKANTEYGDTLDALIEGDATIAMFQYIEKKAGPERFRQWLASGEGQPEEEGEQPEVPPAFGRYGAFPYTYGSAFVRHLYDEGGWEAVNEAYKEPPATEEQILHPEKYAEGEEAVELWMGDLSADLGEGWQQQMDTLFGEFDVYNWLRSTLDNEFQVSTAAAGWGGGRIAVYANPLQPGQSLIHLSLAWDDKQEAREFYTTFSDLVRRIDPEPTLPDPSGQIIDWDAPGEIGHAWVERTVFEMVVSLQPQDLETAKRSLEAPESIPEFAYILQARPGPAQAAPPIRRLDDVLLRPADLPPGFVLVQSGDIDVQIPGLSQDADRRFVLFTDARSPGDGVLASVTKARGILPQSVLWNDLAGEDPRVIFDAFAGSFALGGEVRSFTPLPVEGIGQGAVGARVEVVPPESGPQVVNMIVFGRGTTLTVVMSFQNLGSQEMDTLQLARVMDERLHRFQQ